MKKRSTPLTEPESPRAPTPPWRRAIVVFLAACGGLGSVLFSWHFAGTSVGKIGALVLLGGLFVAGCVLGVFWIVNGFGLPTRAKLIPIVAGSAYAVAVVGVSLFVLIKFPQGTVHVDNYSDRDLKIELDGQPWLEAPKDTTRTKLLRDGKYKLVVRASGSDAVLDRQTVTVAGECTYVLNLLNAQTYIIGRVAYSNTGAESPPEDVVRRPWLDVTTYHYVFVEPPKRIMVSTREKRPMLYEIKTFILRGSPDLLPTKE